LPGFYKTSLLLTTLFIIPPVFADKSKDPSQKLQNVKKELISINQQLKKKRSLKSQHLKKIEKFDIEIASLSRDARKIKLKHKSVTREIDELRIKSKQLSATIDKNKNSFIALAQAIYRLGGENYLKLMLNQADGHMQDRLRVYYRYMHREIQNTHKSLIEESEQLAAFNKSLVDKNQEYKILIKNLKKQSKALEKKRKVKKSFLAKLGKEIKQKKQKVKALKTSRQALEKLLKAFKKRKHAEEMARKSGMSFAKKKGQFPWPVNGKIQHRYGQQRLNSRLKWRGVMIGAKRGAEVSAIEAGTVVFADWLIGYGFVLIIEHNKGFMSLYGHNQQLLKAVGDFVKVGEIIAEVGSSGRLDKPGLYFEIRQNGKPINPRKWIVARKGR